MGSKKEITFYLLQCKRCRVNFVLCRSCYRGHVYCSDECRAEGRREGKRRCNRQNQSTDEGKADHRERQQKYQSSKRKPQDEGSVLPIYCSIAAWVGSSANAGCLTDMVPKDGSAMAISALQTSSPRKKGPQNAGSFRSGTVRCCICGRRGVFVMPFEVKRR